MIDFKRPIALDPYDSEDPSSPLPSQLKTVVDHVSFNEPKQAPYIAPTIIVNWEGATQADLLAILGVQDIVQSSDLIDLVPVVEGSDLFSIDEAERLSKIRQNIYQIAMSSIGSVATRVAGTIAVAAGGVEVSEWTFEVDSSTNLKITHGLNRNIADVKVWMVDGSSISLLQTSLPYSGLVAPDTNTLIIEDLTTKPYPIIINLIFA